MIPSRTLGEMAKRRLDASIHQARAALATRPGPLRAYDRVIGTVYRKGTLLARRRTDEGPDVHLGLVRLAAEVADWVRPVETWCALDASPWVQFASLAEHLLARFPVPRFLASVWLARPDDGHPSHLEWYKRLGRGENIRRMGLPVRLSRAMAHRFLSAPNHCTVVEAIRWAQVLGLGGDPALAKAILTTRLGRVLENEAFWETVIRFFVNAPEMDLEHVGPIVDYLQDRLSSERPEFSIKGRTPASLLRLVDEWHRELGRRPAARITWPRSTLRELTWIERVVVRKEDDVHTEEHVWSIRELCSADLLLAEGRAMRHCVASYTSVCAARGSSIWSLRVETPREQRRILTIEVDMRRRRIVQARRRFNALPTDAERAALGRWAAQEGLGVEEGLRS